jgi:hypothetical protein
MHHTEDFSITSYTGAFINNVPPQLRLLNEEKIRQVQG